MATRGHGVVTRAALLDAGVSASSIARSVRAGRLLVVHPGVYRVGHRAPSAAAVYLAAVLACGDRALLSGQAAGWWLGLVDGEAPVPEVTAPTERRVRGVRVRRCRELGRRDGWHCRGVPVTTVPRTLVDLARSLSIDALAEACHRAGVRYRTTPAQVGRVLDRYPRAKGRHQLELVLGRRVPVTLSRLESTFRARLRYAGLRLPDETNRPASGRRVDCRWYDPPFTVELDSFTFHNSRHSWERDRRREREAYARGDQIRRYTYGDVFENPGPMLAELAALLRVNDPG
ncbi:MAG: type IV toxin-antitoxin system AbiEi family antitoxin domain-containing protein [Solirubrobacteraceae bacterium]